MYQRLTEEEKIELTRDYESGMGLREMCAKHDIGMARACYLAQKNGAKKRTHSPISRELQKQIANEYAKGEKVTSLAKKYLTNRSSIYIWIKENGVQKKRHNIPMIMHDWNAGMTMDKIVQIYQFKNVKSVKYFIANCRKRGYDFKYKNGAERIRQNKSCE